MRRNIILFFVAMIVVFWLTTFFSAFPSQILPTRKWDNDIVVYTYNARYWTVFVRLERDKRSKSDAGLVY